MFFYERTFCYFAYYSGTIFLWLFVKKICSFFKKQFGNRFPAFFFTKLVDMQFRTDKIEFFSKLKMNCKYVQNKSQASLHTGTDMNQ
jgi:hypothetical protein